jgi:hypothetical protein
MSLPIIRFCGKFAHLEGIRRFVSNCPDENHRLIPEIMPCINHLNFGQLHVKSSEVFLYLPSGHFTVPVSR